MLNDAINVPVVPSSRLNGQRHDARNAKER